MLLSQNGSDVNRGTPEGTNLSPTSGMFRTRWWLTQAEMKHFRYRNYPAILVKKVINVSLTSSTAESGRERLIQQLYLMSICLFRLLKQWLEYGVSRAHVLLQVYD